MARSQQQIVSLSDDEDETIADTMKWATNTQRKQMTTEGYCILDGPSNDFKSICLVEGYVRSCFVSHSHPILSTDLIREIVYYYDISLYNDAVYLELVVKNNNHRDMRFLIPKTNACASTFLRRQIEAQLTRISLPNVTACALHSILRYFNYHWINPAKEIEKPLKSNNMREIVSRWDADFINAFTDEELFELILAANYLDIKPLLDLSCAKVASEIKGKTPEEIRKRFGIANDFTPEEEEAVRAENRWAEDT